VTAQTIVGLKVVTTGASTVGIADIWDVLTQGTKMNLDEFVEAVAKAQEKTVNKEVDDWPEWYRNLVIKRLKERNETHE
jgi:hypothetical protein